MGDLVRCKDCEHLFHDTMKRVPPTFLSCRRQQDTAVGRASFMGPLYQRECAKFVVRSASTTDPTVAADAYYNDFMAQVKLADKGIKSAPAPKISAPVRAPQPVRPAVVASNSPFDLGARPAPQPAASNSPARDPFNLEAV